MKTLRMYPTSINSRYIDTIVETLRGGGIIIYPTDTVYAIGCDALNNQAIERICKIKGINPQKQHLSVVCSDISQASEYARIDNAAFKLLKDNLPGAFTFLLPASTRLPKVFKGRKIVGIRIPDNEIAREITRRLGNPILSTSIEWDADQPDEAVEPSAIALRYADNADLMVDGGDGATELSTVVDLTDSRSPEIVREGLGTL